MADTSCCFIYLTCIFQQRIDSCAALLPFKECKASVRYKLSFLSSLKHSDYLMFELLNKVKEMHACLS